MRAERMPLKASFSLVTLDNSVRHSNPIVGDHGHILRSMESDLIEVMLGCRDGFLDIVDVACKPGFSFVTVVACSGGYPGSYTTGPFITITSNPSTDTNRDRHIFHAGTLKAIGDRVIAATAIAPTLQTAVSSAYSTISTISFPGMHYRHVIAHRALFPSSLPLAQSCSPPKINSLTYTSSVSIIYCNTFVSTIKHLVASTNISGSVAAIGSFGGPFNIHLAGYPNGPRLVSGIDSVGTKLRMPNV
ncbi:MAG: hypothetical protein Q9166_004838 [cf. Caloplaca sp. 2 TL-2023]